MRGLERINALDIAPDNESDRSTLSFTILNNNTDVEEEGEVTFIEERRSNENTDEEANKEDNKDIDLVATAMQISKIQFILITASALAEQTKKQNKKKQFIYAIC